MSKMSWKPAAWLGIGLSLLLASCGGGSSTTTTPPATTYTLSIGSTNPASGVSVSVNPADNSGTASGTTPLALTYNANTTVVISAPATAGSNQFSSWSGCTSTTASCTTEMYGNTAITANYIPHGVAITPNPATATIGSTIQFSATVSGTVGAAVNWSVAAPSGSSLSAGTITSTGLYTTPYPAPPTVTVTATDAADTTQSASITVTITAPATATGPALSVDAGHQTHPINPFIYGWNGYSADASASQAANITVDRWGGDATSLYNYKLDVTNAGSDWYFANGVQGTGVEDTSAFNTQVEGDAAAGAKTLGTVGLMGWVAKDNTSCSFPASLYPSQFAFDPFNAACGDGELPDQAQILGNPNNAETPVDSTWASAWVAYLAGKFGTASNGGVAIYSLDNEPDWWDGGHHDVYTHPFSYDDVTNLGLTYAAAIKASDPTAEVSGPVIAYWWDFFYSKKDVEAGWDAGPCGQPWDNPVDRTAHDGIPMIEYYLQQFAAYDKKNSQRLLDYLDLHTYFAADYPVGSGNGLGLTTAGDTGAQQARLNSTRALWDPTYTDPNYPQPNYTTDANYYTANCNIPLQAPQLIPMAQGWVAKDYPNTKIAFTEYNWGGQEHINGALAQADLLGIFGEYGLDMATLWGPPDPTTQIPGLMAYEVFRNYDGKNSKFGNMALASTSVNQGQLSVYGALRSSDNAVTVVVINKTYGDLTSSLSLANLVSGTATAHPFLYSNANLAAIVPQTTVAITPPAAGGTTSTISNYTFPAQSITLFVVLQ